MHIAHLSTLWTATAATLVLVTPAWGQDSPQDVPVDRDEAVIVVAPIDVTAPGPEPSSTGVRALTGDDPESPDADNGLERSAFVTQVRIDERAGETVSVAEVLAESMGVHVRSLGGLGGYSAISVRGGSSGQTTVLVDGVPISRIASVSADLGRFSLDTFSELDLYRGGVPAEFGAAALGGALNLVTAVGKPTSGSRLRLSVGGGSFGARHARARWLDGTRDRRHGYHVAMGYSGGTGDFTYFDDKGTNLDPDDDEYVPRANNAYDQVDAVLRYRGQHADYTVEAGSRSVWKAQGLPGRGSTASTTASATIVGELLDGRVSKRRLWGSPRLHGLVSGFGSLEWQHFSDQDGEARLGVLDQRQLTISSGTAARLAIDAGSLQHISIAADGRFEYVAESDTLDESSTGLASHGWRGGGGLSVSDDLSLGAFDRVVVQPALRLDWLHTVPVADTNQPVVGDGELDPRREIFFSPRISYRARIIEGLVVKGSAGRYVREPTAHELFGGRGVIVGNPELITESGMSVDQGVVFAPPRRFGAVDRLYLETAGFVRQSRDTIVFLSNKGGAFNLGDARAYGVETGASLRVARTATISGNYSWIATRQDSPLPSYDGKPLPFSPEHRAYGRVDVARSLRGRLGVLWVDYTWTTGNFLDRAGLVPLGSRRLLGAGLKLEPIPNLLLGVEGKNLTNALIESVELDPAPRPDLASVPRAVADFHGYPLPGRAVYFTCEWNYQ